MIFKLHYFLLTAGGNALSILLGVFIESYTDASPSELGALLMVAPLLAMLGRPLLCAMADRQQAHRKYLLLLLLVRVVSFSPFLAIPFMGEQVYREHARACWYFLALLKVFGDLAGGGLNSIADSLAINYAKRVGTSFSVYRVWGTISWMLFGLIIGQINEVSFLPKYVPAFMILIGSLALDAFLIWLWPSQYFVMAEAEPELKQQPQQVEEAKRRVAEKQGHCGAGCLMPREAVWAQAKAKLRRVLCCAHFRTHETSWPESKQSERSAVESRKSNPGLGKLTQIRILGVLMRRDKRIVFYLIYFVLAGACHATMSFFFISLSRVCRDQGSCDFSQLAGLLQFSMAALETVLFIYVKRIIDLIGRLNAAALAMLLASAKFLFYGTIWSQVSPYYSLLSEGLTGVIYGINLTLMVETAHLFSGEVRYIIKELLERQIIPADAETEQLRYSLAATMQALVSSASEGIGIGCGSLLYGLLLERVSFETLWLMVGMSCCTCLLVLLAVSSADSVLGLRLGLAGSEAPSDDLDKKAKTKTVEATESGRSSSQLNSCQVHKERALRSPEVL